METLLTVAVEIGKALFSPLKRHVGYLVCYRKKVDDLNEEVDRLKRKRGDVQESVDAIRRRGEEITRGVQGWLDEVDAIDADRRTLNDGVTENKRCFMGCCPNLQFRYRLGKNATRKLTAVDDLKTRGDGLIPNSISVPPPVPTFSSLPANDFRALKSTEQAMEKVMNALKDNTINIIGVYGMGGVGKTTLVEQVGKRVERENLFCSVVKVTVSQNQDIKNIQAELANKLGVTLSEESEEIRASRLSKRLEQEGKILIIFDDLWDTLELARVGIPDVESHTGRKIMMTTRQKDVCRRMDCRATVEVRVLSEEDSWNLFREKVGDEVKTPALGTTVARDVAKECGGLPLAIVTIASALKEKNESIWSNALRELRKSVGTNVKDVHGKLYSRIEWSYNYIQSEEAKSCFLYCSLFPEDHKIDVNILMQYMIGEDLFGSTESLEEAKDKMNAVIGELKDSCLLLEDERDDSIKMHDIVRDVGIQITSRKEYGFVVKAGMPVNEWPQKLEECKRLSLMKSSISVLPEQPSYPNLSVLLLQECKSVAHIPDKFFEGMKNLLVLDLSSTQISSLPASISCLERLRVLDLYYCNSLRDISMLGVMKNLEILNLRNIRIRELPKQIRELVNLKFLDLTHTSPEVIAPNIISSLSKLEELHMGYSFDDWDSSRHDCNATFHEVASLARLTVLYVEVIGEEYLCSDIPGPWENLKKFNIYASQRRSSHLKTGYRTSRYDKCASIEIMSHPIPKWIKLLMKRSEDITFEYCIGIQNLGYLDMGDFNPWKFLTIVKNHEIKHLIDTTEEARQLPPNAFMKLEKIFLEMMENLETFCQGPIPFQFMGNLREMTIFYCHKLEKVLKYDLMLQGLQNLESVDVECCDKLETLFEWEEGIAEIASATPEPLFPRLREVTLSYLPELSTIWKGAVPPLGTLCNLSSLRINGCDSLRCIFSPIALQYLHHLEVVEIQLCPALETIISKEEEEEGVMAVSVRNNTFSSPLLTNTPTSQNLRILVIYRCDGLKNCFLPWSVSRYLQKLEELRVSYCEELTEIIRVNGEVVDEKGVFPCLKHLDLSFLPKLTSICYQGGEKSHICLDGSSLLPNIPIFQNLQKLYIDKCYGLKNCLRWNIARGLQKLEELKVVSCEEITEIIGVNKEGMDTEGLFPALKHLHLVDLPNLTSLCYHHKVGGEVSHVSLDCPSLKMTIIACQNLKKLPLGPGSVPKLEKIEGEIEWFQGLEWEDEGIMKKCQSVFQIYEANPYGYRR